MVFTKAEILCDFAVKVIRQYTIYAIARENYESKDFDQSMWEIWNVIDLLYNAKLEEEKLEEIIKELSDGIVYRYWKYIDQLVQDILKKCRTQEERDAVNICLKRIYEMRKMKIIDIAALKEIRKLEEIIY